LGDFYLVRLTRDDGLQRHVIVVVRADERKGVAVVQASVTTWQAYNNWGGESLYTTSTGQPGGFAKEASFDRPYSDQWGSRGYDLTYLTNLDLDRDPALLDGQRLFLSVGHDEYWSGAERSAVETAIARGVDVAFLGADALEWQIRLEGSAAGAARRTEVCYKDKNSGGQQLALGLRQHGGQGRRRSGADRERGCPRHPRVQPSVPLL
jgi:hypothetical protein